MGRISPWPAPGKKQDPRLFWRKRIEYFFFPDRRQADQVMIEFMGNTETNDILKKVSESVKGVSLPLPDSATSYDERRTADLDTAAETFGILSSMFTPDPSSYPDASGGGYSPGDSPSPDFGGGDGGGGGAQGEW